MTGNIYLAYREYPSWQKLNEEYLSLTKLNPIQTEHRKIQLAIQMHSIEKNYETVITDGRTVMMPKNKEETYVRKRIHC